jgi:BirA family transcriptional regulator, biotin operon repressor / biotin---[acetyl-CoA-carboxylase] ligase
MIPDDLLEYLRKKQNPVTAEELSRPLSISHQAVWKHIQNLRALGYDILSVPHLGYQLVGCPDRLYPAEIGSGLLTKIIGRVIHYYDRIPSTMDAASEFAREKCVEGTVVIAEAQTAGRGRMGRPWVSLEYQGLYFSIIVRPDVSVAQVASIPLMAAVSVVEAIRRTCDLDVHIKWPNDILLRQKKLGGILTEMNARRDRVTYCIIGIGINVNNDRKSLVEGATSLACATGAPVNRITLLQEILRQFEHYYLKFKRQDLAPILDAWRQFSVTLGEQVKIEMQHGRIEGLAVNIDEDGALLVRRDSGIMEKVVAGDVIHCR